MIKSFLLRVLALMKKEFITIWNDPKSRGIIIMMPIMQLLIFSNAVTMEVKNIDTVVLDHSQSVESRELLSRFENSNRFRNFYYVENEKEFQKKLDTQEVQIGINIPNDFSRGIKSKKGTNVLVISDGRQTNSAAIGAGYATQIIAGYNSELTGNTGTQINPTVRNWFNPNLEYKWYILTVIVALLSLVSTLILTALSIARERELGTFDQLIVSPLSSFEILLGKSIPPLIIAMSLTMIMVGIVIAFFHVPFNGSIILFFVSILISLMAIVGVGLFISAICNTQQQAILSVMTFMMPAVLLSGFISPIEDMPVFLQYITYLNPVRFFMVLSRGIFLKGMGLEDIAINIIPLIIIAIITLSLAARTFKRKLG
ncbi:ABC transporter permease [bacterium]|nr:ABC transporter permease [bacterium]